MHNKKQSRQAIWVSVVIVLSLLLVIVTPISASPGVTVDTFGDTFSLQQSGVGETSATADDVSILGGERDVILTVTTGGGPLFVDTNTSQPGQFSHAAGSGVKGRTTIIYDGDDGLATTLNPTGLGGIDITNGGVDTALVVVVTSDDFEAFVKITLFTNATSCSGVIMALPGGISTSLSPKAFLFRYSSFTNVDAVEGCLSPVNTASIGAIKIIIDGTANDSTDITIDLIESAAVDFGDLPTVIGPTNFSPVYASSGPGHAITSLYLGANIDSESGSSSASSLGASNLDDTTGTPDDEDGISVASTPWTEGGGGAVNVSVTGGDGCLAGWIDWESDGVANSSFTETDQVLLNQPVTAGNQLVSFDIPAGALDDWPASYYARFRLYPRDPDSTCTTIKSHKNQAYGGEVEDYLLSFGPTAITIRSLSARPTHTWMIPIAIAFCSILLGILIFLRRRIA